MGKDKQENEQNLNVSESEQHVDSNITKPEMDWLMLVAEIIVAHVLNQD